MGQTASTTAVCSRIQSSAGACGDNNHGNNSPVAANRMQGYPLFKSNTSNNNNSNPHKMSLELKIASLEEELISKNRELAALRESISQKPGFAKLEGDVCIRSTRKQSAAVLVQSYEPLTVNSRRRKIEDYCRDLVINNDHISRMEQRLRESIEKGLDKKTHDMASVKCFPTYVRELPSGHECGKFLALDLGGTNFRVVLIEIGENEKFEMDNEVYAISQDLMNGSGDDLFDHIASCLANFAKARKIDKEVLPLGFTFSFPCKQKGLAVGELIAGHWGGVCNTGKSQSPIDFAEPEFVELEPFAFTHYEREPLAVTLSNNGHSAKIEYSLNEAREPIISGGGLPGIKFGFAQAHFHWGGGSERGSEHTIMGRSYPLELHLVHYNKKYESLMDALPHWDGLAVLGVMFRVSDQPNPDIEDILEAASIIKTPGTSKSVPKISPLDIYLPNNTVDFFRYNGSLTTPPCSESVTWTVFTEPLNISEQQLDQFRYLKDAEGFSMKDNFRPVQPINERRLLTTKVNYRGQDVAPKVLERARYDVYHEEPEEVDHFFLLIMSIIIFFMQCGFAFMEAGAVRSKNTVNILIKNWLDMCIGALVYWAVGFALTFGESRPGLARFMGTSYFFFFDMPAYKLSKWFFQFVFAATAATLVSGSLAERCNFYAYIVYSIMITGFIYPMIAHWTWHREGWLRIHGYHDFAGSGVVHLTGAVCALVGCILMGPRIGRFDKDGKPVPMPGHSVPLAALGGLILVFGFFACNGTKQGSISHPGDGVAIATSIVNTALGTSAAGLCTLIFCKTGIVPGTGHTYSFLLTMNGSLTGTVALCAGCNVYQSWAAVVVGASCGPLFLYSRYFLLSMTIDDPLDAIPVHGIGGLWGVIAVHIFKADGLIMTGSSEAAIGLGWNLIGLATIIVWTGVMCFVMFYILKKNQMLRVETEHEFKGMDLLKHGESAYPADAWVEAQYMKDGGVEEMFLVSLTSVPNGNDDAVEPVTKDNSRDGLPPNMKFSRAASYNNPHEMFPSASKLFSGMNSVAGNVTIQKNSPKNPRSISVSGANPLSTLGEEGTAEEKASLK